MKNTTLQCCRTLIGLGVILLVPLIWGQTVESSITDVQICDFQVPPVVANANATFTVVFTMEIGDGGAPKNIRKVESFILKDKPFIDCIQTWRLPASKNEVVRVEIDWVHSKGWMNLRIMGKTISLRFRLATGTP